MSAPAWSDLETLFHEALARPAATRAAFLADRCAGRPELRAQIEAMLHAHDEAGSAMKTPPVAAQAPLQPGARVGAYEIVGQLGVGGMGEVYRARDGRLRRDVALKVLPAAFTTDADRLARLEREARGPIPPPEALGIAWQIAEALEAAHESRRARSRAREREGPRTCVQSWPSCGICDPRLSHRTHRPCPMRSARSTSLAPGANSQASASRQQLQRQRRRERLKMPPVRGGDA